MTHLLVPITIDALFLGADQTVVGPEMDFESLPYFDAELGVDVNPDSSYLAETIASRPFQNENFVLKAGVHLNWDLPRFLKTGKAQSNGAPEFPPAPTRWLVARYASTRARAGGADPEARWVVQSDLVLQELQGMRFDLMAQTSLDVDIHSRPYSYMGRTDELTAWQRRGGAAPAGYTTWKATHGQAPLTAVGWGSLAFDVFYPNCHGVFGFHDPSIIAIGAEPPVYVVVGWYEDPEDDAWLTYLSDQHPGAEPPGLADRDHLTETQRHELWNESIRKALQDDLGIALQGVQDLIGSLPDEGMLCAGMAEPSAGALPPAGPARVAIGNTPVEALTAMIVGEAFGDLQGPDRERLEDTLSAALMGDRLKSLVADIGPQYCALRHRESFTASAGGLVWEIRRSDGSATQPSAATGPDSGPPATNRRSPVPPLPDGVAALLDGLNQAQQAYDQARFALESRQTALYADWSRYMRCAYPPAGETDSLIDPGELMAWIEQGSLNLLTSESEKLGGPLRSEPWATEPPSPALDSSLADAVIGAWSALHEGLQSINASLPQDAKFHWLLQTTPAQRFWEPAPPAVVLALPKGAAGAAPPPAGDLVSCKVLSGRLDLQPGSFDAGPLLAAAEQQATTAPGLFNGEWEVELFPEAAMHRISEPSGSYDPGFIEHSYALGDDATDLTDQQGLGGPVGVMRTGAVYAGRCFTNQRAGARYMDLLDGFLELPGADSAFSADIHQARAFLADHDLLAVTLNGFNSALLQRHETVQLRPADPLGFEDFQSFAEDVARALPGGKAYAPDPLTEFLPIRSGALRLQAVRLVDTFGRVTEIHPEAVHRPLAMQILDQPDWVRLPPRLSQPARFNLSFRRRDGGGEAACDSLPAHSPICGWLVPNLLDGSLVLFGPDGQRAGTIDQNGDWQVGPAAPAPDSFLERVREWITGGDKGSGFVGTLIEALEESMDNIHPTDRDGQTAYSVLMGRPMALARLGVELELEGEPAFDLSWNELRRDLDREGRETAGFENVRFPYRLGEYRQLDDGLVGFWPLTADGVLGETFQVGDSLSAAVDVPEDAASRLPAWLQARNQAWTIQGGQTTLLDHLRGLPTIKKQDLIQPYLREGARLWDALVGLGWLTPEAAHPHIGHYADTGLLSLCAASPRQEYLCLVDPFGCLHLSSGIQPVRSVRLSPGHFRDVLRRLEITFLTAPLLGPETPLRLSLPRLPEFTWGWEEPNAWAPGAEPPAAIDREEIHPFSLTADFPNRVVAREGRLVIRRAAGGPAAAEQPATEPTEPPS